MVKGQKVIVDYPAMPQLGAVNTLPRMSGTVLGVDARVGVAVVQLHSYMTPYGKVVSDDRVLVPVEYLREAEEA